MLWPWFILTGVLGAPLTLILHESSHALTAILHGCRILKFRPWPNPWRPIGRLGMVSWQPPKGMSTERYLAVRTRSAITPMVKGLVLALVWGLLSILWLPLICLAAWELIDAATWILQWFNFPKLWGRRFHNFDAQVFRRRGKP